MNAWPAAYVFALSLVACDAIAQHQPVVLEVAFRLTDLEYKPIAAAARIVSAQEPGWQRPDAGVKLTTDSDGRAHASLPVLLTRKSCKRPTNFWSELVARAESCEVVRIGAELQWAGHPWLHVVQLMRFPDGDVLLDSHEVYTLDATGSFTTKAEHVGQDWKVSYFPAMLLTGVGHIPFDFMLAPKDGASAGTPWTLRLAFRQSPQPVVR
jgi:hypothetical protein